MVGSMSKKERIRTENVRNGTVYQAWDYISTWCILGTLEVCPKYFFPGKFSVERLHPIY